MRLIFVTRFWGVVRVIVACWWYVWGVFQYDPFIVWGILIFSPRLHKRFFATGEQNLSQLIHGACHDGRQQTEGVAI